MSSAQEIRNLINLLNEMNASNQMSPQLVKYINSFPDEVFDTEQQAMDKIIQDAQGGAKFAWGIGKLPDKRFITAFPNQLEKWNLPIVKQGTSDEL